MLSFIMGAKRPNVRLNLKSPVKGGVVGEPWVLRSALDYWIAITRGTIKGFPTVF